MIKAKFYLKGDTYFGFALKGHAEYGQPGEDILCSAVSAMAINTVNSLEELTEDRLMVETREGEDAFLRAKISGRVSHDSHILIKSLVIGLCNTAKEYGDDFIRVYFRDIEE